LWETFRHIEVAGGRHAFLAHNGNFLCAELQQDRELSATGERLGDFGLFTFTDAGDGSVGIKAHNGLYLAVDPGSFQVFARDSTIGPLSRFRVVTATALP